LLGLGFPASSGRSLAFAVVGALSLYGCASADPSAEQRPHEDIGAAMAADSVSPARWFFAATTPEFPGEDGNAVGAEIIALPSGSGYSVRVFFCGGPTAVRTETRWMNGNDLRLDDPRDRFRMQADVTSPDGALTTTVRFDFSAGASAWNVTG